LSDKRIDKAIALAFIQDNCIKPANLLVNAGSEIPALMLVCLGVEWLGSHMENIPSGAKNRSRKRFELALNRCFPEPYRNRNLDLYRRLRTAAIHNPVNLSSKITLCEPARHLETENERILISVKTLIADLETCIVRLKE
jgi:hypothetical protein